MKPIISSSVLVDDGTVPTEVVVAAATIDTITNIERIAVDSHFLGVILAMIRISYRRIRG